MNASVAENRPVRVPAPLRGCEGHINWYRVPPVGPEPSEADRAASQRLLSRAEAAEAAGLPITKGSQVALMLAEAIREGEAR